MHQIPSQITMYCPCRTSEEGVLIIAVAVYLAAVLIGFTNAATVQPVVAVERPVFYRSAAVCSTMLHMFLASQQGASQSGAAFLANWQHVMTFSVHANARVHENLQHARPEGRLAPGLHDRSSQARLCHICPLIPVAMPA